MRAPRRVNKRARIALLGLVLLVLLFPIEVVQAGSSAHYAISWQVLSGGGAPAASSSGEVALNASLGQTAIGASASAGDGDTLGAGYWYGALGGDAYVYLPLVLKEY
jgi:hypothetical protein